MLFSLYNHFQRLWRGADGTSISTLDLMLHVDVGGRREASIKWGLTTTTRGGTKKSSSDCAKDQPSLINSVHPCLIVMNTILTVIHILQFSFLTHYLQIYYTGFTVPRSHTSWAWAAKYVPTVMKLFFNLFKVATKYKKMKKFYRKYFLKNG